jgi:hypothetical protein
LNHDEPTLAVDINPDEPQAEHTESFNQFSPLKNNNHMPEFIKETF